MKVEERFWSKVQVGSDQDCWIWLGAVDIAGYGRFGAKGYGRATLAHRMAWALTHGEIAAGLCVLHRCDNPPCVNPGHLFLGTRADNNRDMMQKGRHPNRGARGERNASSKLSEAGVVEMRALYATGKTTFAELGRIFGVSSDTAQRAVIGTSWADVPGTVRVDTIA